MIIYDDEYNKLDHIINIMEYWNGSEWIPVCPILDGIEYPPIISPLLSEFYLYVYFPDGVESRITEMTLKEYIRLYRAIEN